MRIFDKRISITTSSSSQEMSSSTRAWQPEPLKEIPQPTRAGELESLQDLKKTEAINITKNKIDDSGPKKRLPQVSSDFCQIYVKTKIKVLLSPNCLGCNVAPYLGAVFSIVGPH